MKLIRNGKGFYVGKFTDAGWKYRFTMDDFGNAVMLDNKITTIDKLSYFNNSNVHTKHAIFRKI